MDRTPSLIIVDDINRFTGVLTSKGVKWTLQNLSNGRDHTSFFSCGPFKSVPLEESSHVEPGNVAVVADVDGKSEIIKEWNYLEKMGVRNG